MAPWRPQSLLQSLQSPPLRDGVCPPQQVGPLPQPLRQHLRAQSPAWSPHSPKAPAGHRSPVLLSSRPAPLPSYNTPTSFLQSVQEIIPKQSRVARVGVTSPQNAFPLLHRKSGPQEAQQGDTNPRGAASKAPSRQVEGWDPELGLACSLAGAAELSRCASGSLLGTHHVPGPSSASSSLAAR